MKPEVIIDFRGQQYVRETSHKGNVTIKRNFPVMRQYMKKHLFIILGFLAICISLVNCASTQQTKSDAYCEKCARLEKSILEILYTVEEHDPNFVLDVLSETDEWCILEELIGPIPPVIIKDSTYRRMRLVFPDMPAEQAKPIK